MQSLGATLVADGYGQSVSAEILSFTTTEFTVLLVRFRSNSGAISCPVLGNTTNAYAGDLTRLIRELPG